MNGGSSASPRPKSSWKWRGQVWTNAAPSYALLAAGGLLVGASVWFSIDEVRAGRARRATAMVGFGWTSQF